MTDFMPKYKKVAFLNIFVTEKQHRTFFYYTYDVCIIFFYFKKVKRSNNDV